MLATTTTATITTTILVTPGIHVKVRDSQFDMLNRSVQLPLQVMEGGHVVPIHLRRAQHGPALHSRLNCVSEHVSA